MTRATRTVLVLCSVVATCGWGLLSPPAVAQSQTYTDDPDFDQGSYSNVVHAVPGQLRLDDATEPFKFIWIAVSTKGTTVKINTETGQILGEYRTAPEGQPTDPSRTTVDLNGNVWNTNRAGNSVVHIGLLENNQCVDRNGNGVIDTSTGLGDVRAWTNAGGVDTDGGVDTAADECIVHYVRVRSSGTRHVSVTRDNDVWVSGTGTREFDLIDGDTGVIIRQEGPVGYGGYGGLIDGNGVIWSARYLLRWDTSLPLSGASGINWTGYGHDSYGLCIDSSGNVWNTALNANTIYKFAPDGSLLGTYSHGYYYAQGCVVGPDDDVWVAHSLYGNTVGHIKNNGTYVGNVTVGSGPTGVAVDADGKIWATNYYSGTASRIDPAGGGVGADGVTRIGAVDLTTVSLGGNLYNYSDMTGSTLQGAPESGSWEVVYDSGGAGTEWGTVSWTADVSGDGSITVTASSSTDGVSFGAPEIATDGGDLAVANGRYLKVRVVFYRASTGESPILYDLTVTAAGTAACVDLDGDGYGDPGSADCPNGDATDCNDRRAGINPGATEVCNHYDDDCDGLGNEGLPGCDLAVVLDGFSVEIVKGGVLLRWRTQSEVEHYGFRVLRSMNGGATLETLGGTILGRGSETEGADYEYLDDVGRMSGTASYWLEDIDLFGTVTRHGPVSVTLQPFRERSGVDRGERERR